MEDTTSIIKELAVKQGEYAMELNPGTEEFDKAVRMYQSLLGSQVDSVNRQHDVELKAVELDERKKDRICRAAIEVGKTAATTAVLVGVVLLENSGWFPRSMVSKSIINKLKL